MLSKSAKYAIKAVLYLSIHSSEDRKVMIKDIATPINVPKAYIAKLLQELSKNGVVSSIKGPKGGFYLSEKDREASIVEIIKIIDGEDRMSNCLLSLSQCNNENPCPLHHLAYKEKQTILKKLKGSTIDQLSEHVKSGNSILPL